VRLGCRWFADCAVVAEGGRADAVGRFPAWCGLRAGACEQKLPSICMRALSGCECSRDDCCIGGLWCNGCRHRRRLSGQVVFETGDCGAVADEFSPLRLVRRFSAGVCGCSSRDVAVIVADKSGEEVGGLGRYQSQEQRSERSSAPQRVCTPTPSLHIEYFAPACLNHGCWVCEIISMGGVESWTFRGAGVRGDLGEAYGTTLHTSAQNQWSVLQ
jgi:hypothetical protein